MTPQNLNKRKAIHAKLLYNNLRKNKLTIAFAESISGGSLMAELVKIKGASQILRGGVVCYQPIAKMHLLDIEPKLMKYISCESQEMSNLLARNLKHTLNADIHVAITGLADSGASESQAKPVGSIFVTILHKGKTHTLNTILKGERNEVLLQAVIYCFKNINRVLFYSQLVTPENQDDYRVLN